ncbi:hypothetical protein OEZ86_014308 [Tetradesmus obliquus]|nr:hypothetical protein OEZ86_014308 [Tetradesmus obliquus]
MIVSPPSETKVTMCTTFYDDAPRCLCAVSVAGDDLLSMPNPCSQWAAGSAHQNVDGLYAVPSPGCLQYVSCKQGTPDGPVMSCAPGQMFSLAKQACVSETTGYCMYDAVAAASGASGYINQNSSTPQLGNRKLMQPAQNATPAYLDPSNWYMWTKYEPFDVNRVSKWMNITPEFPLSAVQYYKVSSACYPQELCLGSPKYKSGYYGTQLVSATTTFYECEQGKIWDGKSSCVPGASPYTGTDTSAYVDVPGLVSSGDKQKALPCSSMDGVVRAALIANPQATFALRDSGNSSVKPTFFTVKNADAVVASEEVQEIVMEYFDTRVYELSNATVFNWTQDRTHSTRKTMSKQTRLIQRPNGVSTLVRQVSADGLCWFGIATNSSDAPKTPDEAAKAVAIDAAANATAMLPTGSGTALALADGEEYDYTTVLEVGAATAGGLAAVGIVALCVAGSAAPIVGSLVPIAIGTAAALVGMGSVAAVTVVAFAIAAGAIILGAVLVIGVAAAITALIDGACFPAAATAYLALSAGVTGGIGTKRMDQLMLGDSLMTMHALNGSATASPVYLFGHKDAATYGSFVQLQLQSTFALSRVLSKETVLLQGLYAPFTMTGDLVVNGVLVSAHSDWYLDRVMPQSHVHRLPAIYQATMAPARLAYRLGGAPLMEFLDSKLHLVELASAVSL